MAKSKKTQLDNKNMSHVIAKKHITFFERLSQDHTSHCRCRLCSRRVTTQPVTVKVFDEISQRMKTVTKHQVIDNKAFLSQFNVNDFALQSLIDTGALASMTSVCLSGDNLSSIANVSRLMDSLDNAEKLSEQQTSSSNSNS